MSMSKHRLCYKIHWWFDTSGMPVHIFSLRWHLNFIRWSFPRHLSVHREVFFSLQICILITQHLSTFCCVTTIVLLKSWVLTELNQFCYLGFSLFVLWQIVTHWEAVVDRMPYYRRVSENQKRKLTVPFRRPLSLWCPWLILNLRCTGCF